VGEALSAGEMSRQILYTWYRSKDIDGRTHCSTSCAGRFTLRLSMIQLF
jgi:hypothetical protein